MALYNLEAVDVSDLLALITHQSLAISAPQASRVAQLQSMLATMQPAPHEWHGCEECKSRAAREQEVLAILRQDLSAALAQGDELMKQRDKALLELGLERAKVAALSALNPPTEASTHIPL